MKDVRGNSKGVRRGKTEEDRLDIFSSTLHDGLL